MFTQSNIKTHPKFEFIVVEATEAAPLPDLDELVFGATLDYVGETLSELTALVQERTKQWSDVAPKAEVEAMANVLHDASGKLREACLPEADDTGPYVAFVIP